MPSSIAYNCDCMEYMKTLPDNAFDLAVVDPPYGDASTHGRGTDKGKTADNQMEHGDMPSGGRYNRFGNPGSRFEKYKMEQNRPPSQQLPQERERETVARTGGTWAEKYGKKS